MACALAISPLLRHWCGIDTDEPPRRSRATLIPRKTCSSVCRARAARPMMPPNARLQAWLKSRALRTLYPVACTSWFGSGALRQWTLALMIHGSRLRGPGPGRRRGRPIRGEPADDLLFHPQFVDEDSQAVVPSQGGVAYAPCTVEGDTLAVGHPHHGLPANGARIDLRVERTPGPRLFMAFPEGLPADVQVLQATIQPLRLMQRTPPDIPSAVALATVDAPDRMRDACGRGLVEAQRGTV